MLVVDIGLALRACLAAYDDVLAVDDDLVAPPLLWSEARSALHEAGWRGESTVEAAEDAHRHLHRLRVRPRSPAGLGAEAWRVAG